MSKLSEKIKYPTSEFKYWKWDDDFQKELIALEVENQKLKETRNRHHPEMLKLTEERDRYKAQTKKAEDEVKTLNEAWDKQNVELCTTINIQKLEIIKLKERLAKAQDTLDEAWKLTQKQQDVVGDCDSSVAYESFREAVEKYVETLDPCKRCQLGIDGVCVPAEKALGGES